MLRHSIPACIEKIVASFLKFASLEVRNEHQGGFVELDVTELLKLG
jgi:hypothetical protein